MPFSPKYYASLCMFACSAGLFATPGKAAESEHLCDNELACMEDQYQQKKYDPVDFAALKLIVGGEESVSYNDNIFRAASNEESDIINRLAPRVALKSDLDQHYWMVEVKAENAIYFSNSENNYTDFSAIADGRYDFNDETAIAAGGGYVLDNVTIGSFVDNPTALNVEPTPFHTVLGYTTLDHLPKNIPLHFKTGLGVNVINYENVAQRSGGTDIQDDRDRVEYSGMVQLGYRIDQNKEVYAKTAHEAWEHDERIDSSTLSTRDSEQHRYQVGFRNDSRLINGLIYDVAVGYLEQDYDAARLPGVSGLDLYADVHWDMDQENNLRLLVIRDVRDAYSNDRSAYLRTRARVNYEHDYSPLITLGSGVSYTNNDFESTSTATINREDDVYGAHLWGAYEFYKDLDAKLFYDYTDRDSNDPAADYGANVIGIALSYKN